VHERPGFDVDVTMSSDVNSLYQVWLGKIPVREAVARGQLSFSGPTALVRGCPTCWSSAPWPSSSSPPIVDGASGRGFRSRAPIGNARASARESEGR
jgi:hypothetical protein